MRTAFILAPVILALTGFACGAAAQTPETRIVQYGDLNLTSEAGRETFQRRIDHAINQVCHVNLGERQLRTRSAQRACVRAARPDAQGQADAAILHAGQFAWKAPAPTPMALLALSYGDAGGGLEPSLDDGRSNY
jgi:UrcA family protein